MSKGKELFSSLMARVKASGLIHEILKVQVDRYQIQPLKQEQLECDFIESLYQSLEFKYLESHELVEDPETWNDNQKKLFIWVIIFYGYFLEEDGLEMTPDIWAHLSPLFFNKDPNFLHFQYLNLIKPQGKICWTSEEDELLTKAVAEAGEGHWNQVSRFFFEISKHRMFKSPKHCRERWLNHLDDKKKRGNWTPEEDLQIFTFVAENGKRWCKLVSILKETRTEHMIKNRFNSILNRQKNIRRDTDHLIPKVIRQLKKQISNIEKKKQKKELLEKTEKTEESQLKVEPQPKSEAIEEEHFYKEVDERDEDKQSHTPASIDSTPKKEPSQEQAYIVPEVQKIPEMPYYPMPPYYPDLTSYPFLFQQHMQLMQYYMSCPPYQAQ